MNRIMETPSDPYPETLILYPDPRSPERTPLDRAVGVSPLPP